MCTKSENKEEFTDNILNIKVYVILLYCEVRRMKISSLLHRANPEFEYKKRALQRKEVGEAYKKNAKYADPTKNPMLQALENLLSGKTEKDLHEADTAARKESQQFLVEVNEQQLERPENKSENNMNSNELSMQIRKFSDEPEQTIELLEKLRQAALAPAQPSTQDLRVAASASAQIQQVRSELTGDQIEENNEEIAPFAEANFMFEVPERFQKDFVRNPEEQTIFGQELEKRLSQRTFNMATEKYSSHISMVNNGYRSIFEPTLSISA